MTGHRGSTLSSCRGHDPLAQHYFRRLYPEIWLGKGSPQFPHAVDNSPQSHGIVESYFFRVSFLSPPPRDSLSEWTTMAWGGRRHSSHERRPVWCLQLSQFLLLNLIGKLNCRCFLITLYNHFTAQFVKVYFTIREEGAFIHNFLFIAFALNGIRSVTFESKRTQ